MEKLIKLNNEYYLLNDEPFVVGKEYDSLVANFDGTYWNVFKTNRLLPSFKEVIASTDAQDNSPMLSRVQIESIIEKEEYFTLTEDDIYEAIKRGSEWAKHNRDRSIFDVRESFINSLRGREKPSEWNVEIEKEHSRVVGGGLLSVEDFGGKGPQVYEHSQPKRNNQGYITILSVK